MRAPLSRERHRPIAGHAQALQPYVVTTHPPVRPENDVSGCMPRTKERPPPRRRRDQRRPTQAGNGHVRRGRRRMHGLACRGISRAQVNQCYSYTQPQKTCSSCTVPSRCTSNGKKKTVHVACVLAWVVCCVIVDLWSMYTCTSGLPTVQYACLPARKIVERNMDYGCIHFCWIAIAVRLIPSSVTYHYITEQTGHVAVTRPGILLLELIMAS